MSIYDTTPHKPGNPIVVTEAKTLDRAADEILKISETRTLSKNTVLNTIAKAICGKERNWGFLKGHDGPVTDQRLSLLPENYRRRNLRPYKVSQLTSNQIFNLPVETLTGDRRTLSGSLPLAELSSREDGGIDIRGFTWGSAYEPSPDQAVYEVGTVLPPESVQDLAKGWPTAESLTRDTSWGKRVGGFHMTVNTYAGQPALFFQGGLLIIDAEALLGLARKIAEQAKK